MLNSMDTMAGFFITESEDYADKLIERIDEIMNEDGERYHIWTIPEICEELGFSWYDLTATDQMKVRHHVETYWL